MFTVHLRHLINRIDVWDATRLIPAQVTLLTISVNFPEMPCDYFTEKPVATILWKFSVHALHCGIASYVIAVEQVVIAILIGSIVSNML